MKYTVLSIRLNKDAMQAFILGFVWFAGELVFSTVYNIFMYYITY